MIKNTGTFLKAQLSSTVSSLTDFTVTFLLTSVFSYWYVFTSFLGTISGGIANFSINRNWVFNSKQQTKSRQMLKFIIVWIGSLLLNLSGVILLTEVFKWHYLASKAFTSLLVGFFFNYLLQQNYVFVKVSKNTTNSNH